MQKTCQECGETKPLAEFHVRRDQPDGRQRKCKVCIKRYRDSRRDVYREYALEKRLRDLYDISLEEYEALVEAQDGRCAICGSTSPGKRDFNWTVDHDHDTELVRGLLCRRCNVGLGQFLDSRDLLVKAIAYLDAAAAKLAVTQVDI